MDTIKTAVVVALLLAVLYGVYTVLNKETAPPPADVSSLAEEEALLAPPDIELGLVESPGEDVSVDVESDEPAGPRIASTEVPPAAPGSSIYVNVPQSELPAAGNPATENPQAELSPRVQVEVEPLRSSASPPSDTASGSRMTAPPTSLPSTQLPTNPGSTYADTAGADGTPDADTEEPSDPAVTSLPPVGSAPAPGTTSIYGRQAQPATGSGENGLAAAAAPAGTTAAPQTSGAKLAEVRFDDVKAEAERRLADRDYRGALTALSSIYGEPTLSPEQQQQLLGMLDPLAGKVIYSREHLLEPSYVVRGGETLAQVAQQYRVPWQLLQNINGVQNPDVLLPGTELKVVRGPFRAEIDLDGAELVLFLDQLYAGRFPINVGNEPSPAPGNYAVQEKQEGRTYFAPDGRTIAAAAADNPYGSVWLDLGVNNVCIHGSASRDGTPAAAGCIGLSPIDARDVYGILSQGSQVTIYR